MRGALLAWISGALCAVQAGTSTPCTLPPRQREACDNAGGCCVGEHCAGTSCASLQSAPAERYTDEPPRPPSPAPTPKLYWTIVTSAPSASPTSAPSPAPTRTPTRRPTQSPTSAPTAIPTMSPTVAPTAHPTRSPTLVPTRFPTMRPTPAPTPTPTALPTPSPTSRPTSAPTPAPPTPAPTPSPTPTIHCSPGLFRLPAPKDPLSPCGECPPGTFSTRMRSWNATLGCLPCLPGRYGIGGSVNENCTGPCAEGYYGTGGSTNPSCSGQCPAGRWSTEGQRACKACAPGRYGRRGSFSSRCDGKCVPGRFSQGGAEGCTACEPGTFVSRSGATMCLDCIPGRFAALRDNQMYQGSVRCHECALGRYQPFSKQRECFECPAGKYVDARAAEACKDCPAGLLGSGGSTTALCSGVCPPGRFTFNGIGCSDCPPGKFGDSRGLCSTCPAGRFGTSARMVESRCSGACDVGRYGLGGSTSAKCTAPCPPGTLSGVSGGSANASCAGPCKVGTYSTGGADLCSYCPPGKFANTSGATFCYDCPRGKYSNFELNIKCLMCPLGKYAPQALGSENCVIATPAPTPPTAAPTPSPTPPPTSTPTPCPTPRPATCAIVQLMGILPGEKRSGCMGQYRLVRGNAHRGDMYALQRYAMHFRGDAAKAVRDVKRYDRLDLNAANFTVMVWVQASRASGLLAIHGMHHTKSMALSIDAEGRPYFQASKNGHPLQKLSGMTNVLDGSWHSIIVTSCEGERKIFVDGGFENVDGKVTQVGKMASLPFQRASRVFLGGQVVGRMTGAAWSPTCWSKQLVKLRASIHPDGWIVGEEGGWLPAVASRPFYRMTTARYITPEEACGTRSTVELFFDSKRSWWTIGTPQTSERFLAVESTAYDPYDEKKQWGFPAGQTLEPPKSAIRVQAMCVEFLSPSPTPSPTPPPTPPTISPTPMPTAMPTLFPTPAPTPALLSIGAVQGNLVDHMLQATILLSPGGQGRLPRTLPARQAWSSALASAVGLSAAQVHITDVTDAGSNMELEKGQRVSKNASAIIFALSHLEPKMLRSIQTLMSAPTFGSFFAGRLQHHTGTEYALARLVTPAPSPVPTPATRAPTPTTPAPTPCFKRIQVSCWLFRCPATTGAYCASDHQCMCPAQTCAQYSVAVKGFECVVVSMHSTRQDAWVSSSNNQALGSQALQQLSAQAQRPAQASSGRGHTAVVVLSVLALSSCLCLLWSWDRFAITRVESKPSAPQKTVASAVPWEEEEQQPFAPHRIRPLADFDVPASATAITPEFQMLPRQRQLGTSPRGRSAYGDAGRALLKSRDRDAPSVMRTEPV